MPTSLNSRFSAPGLRFDTGNNGLTRLSINTELAECEIYLHGAHVTHWRPRRFHPVLWLSEKAAFQPGKAIRGGIPICWPWFGAHPSDPAAKAHGFVRTTAWDVAHAGLEPDGSAVLTLTLPNDAIPHSAWPHEAELTLTVRAGTTLSVTLNTRNTGSAPLTISEALHTYLAVGDVQRTRIEGYGGAAYIDSLRAGAHAMLPNTPVTFDAETDRVVHSPSGCVLIDPSMNRRISIAKRGSGSTVIWNPWPQKSARLGDVAPDAWREFVCIEAANALEQSISIAPGDLHSIETTLAVTWLS